MTVESVLVIVAPLLLFITGILLIPKIINSKEFVN